MRGEYKVLLPEGNECQLARSPRGKYAQGLKRHWDILINLCKSLKKNKIPYEVEYFLRVEEPYALIFAGKAVRQMELLKAA